MDFLLLAIHHYLPEVSVNFIIDEELRLLIPPLSRELTFPVKSEDSSEERCYAEVDLMIEME
jgi:hypothetical protein